MSRDVVGDTLRVVAGNQVFNSAHFLGGAFAKLRKTTIGFCHVCPFAWNISAPTRRIFMKFDILSILRKTVGKIQVSSKPDKNNAHFT